MKKQTQKFIKDMVRINLATDITTADTASYIHIDEKIFYSVGVYGVNGLLFRGTDGNLYAITARSSQLFRYL